MKKPFIILLSALVVGLAFNVQAASVSFEPQAVELKVAPGETGRTAITVHGFSNRPYSLNFLVGSKLEKSNIPRGWLNASYLWLDAESQGASSRIMNLVVTVPSDTKPGTYSAVLVPDDMRSSESITSNGVFIAIKVPGP